MRARGASRATGRRGPDLATRTAALREVCDLGSGRLPHDVLAQARTALEQVEQRSALSAEHTLVALAGATGTGKSSLLNALAGQEVARTSRQRPTTSLALGVVAESPGRRAGSTALLDWLGVPRRHDVAPDDERPDGVILLDLPDHDSVVVEHRVRADHVTQRADLLVWVTNPQKYADAVLHHDYLAPLAGQGGVVVVLNQVDRLSPADAEACRADLARLVARAGIDAPVLATSATTGAGLAELRRHLHAAVSRRTAVVARSSARLAAAATAVLDALGGQGTASYARAHDRARAELTARLEQAAGVPLVVDAVRGSAVRDAVRHTGWPPTRWLGRWRRDPLRTLGLRGPARRSAATSGDSTVTDTGDLVRSSLPAPSPALRSAATSAVRTYVDAAGVSLPPVWRERVRAEVLARTEHVGDDLDVVLTRTSLGAVAPARWWRAVGAWQWLLAGALAVGLLWLGALAVIGYLQLPPWPTPVATLGGRDLPWPTLLAVGGAVAGLLTALLARWAAGAGAARRARRTRQRLRRAVDGVAHDLVVAAVRTEIQAAGAIRAAAAQAAA
ncbi:GTPase [Litorihabitans aurantiacus]|uniref:G domain-containing protein n=1 Tax=Litorihabitans aurantiacus TaxID=1930061 RepID=A0AA38CTH7_9MICO|nr:GTPase [Litorihabitans aurantiacus]GMA31917.1 hypothetical protein GCM10025875_19090 [Litorihabitans aurantiacus]